MIDGYEEKYATPYGYANTAPNPSAPQQAVSPTPQYASVNNTGVAKIKVVGVGGAGNNAVDRLIESGLKCAEYYAVNTDRQTLIRSKATNKIQIGTQLTKGLGAGSDPAVGKAAAEENKAELQAALKDTDLLFITAGMGGGTGTGAAPVIAKIAKDMKILTVAVVTLPFSFEAKARMDNAMAGIEDLGKSVDAIITIPNDKIQQVVQKGTSFADALKVADEVLRQGIRGIAEVISKHSLINLDFADVKATLKGKGIAHMGIGVAKGEKRIVDAVRCAVCSPLLNTTIEGASSVILNIIGGEDLSFDEVSTAANLVKGVIDYSARVIFGTTIDKEMSDEVEIVLIATGFNDSHNSFGVESQASSMKRVAELSRKIDNLSNAGKPMETPTDPYGYPPQAQMSHPQQASDANGYMGQPMQPVPPYYPSAQMQQQTGYPQQYSQEYPQPMPSVQPTYPQNTNGFEPNDPMPNTGASNGTDAGNKKRTPKFARFFMKRNSEDNEE